MSRDHVDRLSMVEDDEPVRRTRQEEVNRHRKEMPHGRVLFLVS